MATGCYTPPYFQASFKGIVFDAMEVSSEHGRRGAEGEFPFGEETAYADLGRRIRTYTLRGRFATNDHAARATALIAVCEAPGPGVLIHPTRGAVTVACRSIKVTDDPLEGQGVTYVDLDMVEANLFGSGFSLGGFLNAGLSLTTLIATMSDTFNDRYTPRTARPYNRNAITGTASAAILQIRDEFHAAVVKPSSPIDPNAWSAISDLERRAQDTTVLFDAQETFTTIKLGLAAVSASTANDTKYEAFLRLANANAKLSALSGVNDRRAEDVIYATMRVLSAGYMAQAALEDTATVNALEMSRRLEQISSILETEIDAARIECDNNLFLQLRQFYTATQAALLKRVFSLPAMVVYNFAGAVHSLVAAYEIHNDAKRFRDIEALNPSSWPWNLGPRVVATR